MLRKFMLDGELVKIKQKTDDPNIIEAAVVLSSVVNRLCLWSSKTGDECFHIVGNVVKQIKNIVTNMSCDIDDGDDDEVQRKFSHIRDELLRIFGHYACVDAGISSFEIGIIGS